MLTGSVSLSVPIVKDQARMAGSANLPGGIPAVSTANMMTGEAHTHRDRSETYNGGVGGGQVPGTYGTSSKLTNRLSAL